MKYVCKKLFVRCVPLGDGKFITVDVHVGDIFEYLGIDEDGLCEFKTDKGYCIRLSLKAVDDLLEKVENGSREKINGLLHRVCRAEYEIVSLREELEEILQELE